MGPCTPGEDPGAPARIGETGWLTIQSLEEQEVIGSALRELVQARLAGYPLSLSDTEKKLQAASSLPFQEKMITMFTLSEMRLLEQVSSFLVWDDSVIGGAKDEL